MNDESALADAVAMVEKWADAAREGDLEADAVLRRIPKLQSLVRALNVGRETLKGASKGGRASGKARREADSERQRMFYDEVLARWQRRAHRDHGPSRTEILTTAGKQFGYAKKPTAFAAFKREKLRRETGQRTPQH